ncbi:DUF2953 domain-containing protein [Sporolactobacillus terrae]|uniref:DUF2953 domain-containing protein n=1 Tax=Sporolactobacillus terrae TaxID=269673 RepID=UPI001117DC2B|nr:DUF2953 domain-containing protein [Sporolactobacillus terrae]
MVRLFIVLSGLSVGLLILLVLFILKSTLTLRVKYLIGVHHFEWKADLYLGRKKIFTFHSETPRKKPRGNPSSKKNENKTISQNDEKQTTDRAAFLYQQLEKGVDFLRTGQRGQSIQMTHVVWVTTCGTGDAAETAMVCGLIWAVKASLLPWVNAMSADHPRINVVPAYQRKCLNSALSCMFQMRFGDAIAMIRKLRSQLKEG